MATIYIPTPLRVFSNGKARVEVDAPQVTISELLSSLEEICPGIRREMFDDFGALRRYLNIFVNSDHVRDIDGTGVRVVGDDEVYIIAAMAGG